MSGEHIQLFSIPKLTRNSGCTVVNSVCVCVYARACVCALVCACMFLTSSADCMTTMDPFPEETATVASEAPTQ